MIPLERIKILKGVFQSHWCSQDAMELFDEIDRLLVEREKVQQILKQLKEVVIETGFSSNSQTYLDNHLEITEHVLALVKIVERKEQP